MQAGDLVKTGGIMVTCLLFLVAAGCQSSESKGGPIGRSGTAGTPLQTVTGTVEHVDVEGGFYGIRADDGTKWDPVNLPEDFQKDGVRVQVRVHELTNRVSPHMWGKVARIVEIKRLPPVEGTAK
jgi:hypothetical protein